MIVLDTNIISEVMKPAPALKIVRWLDGLESASLYISTITIAEICFGLRVLPKGIRRRRLEEKFERFVALGFEERVLSFDEEAARSYGEIQAHRRGIGQPLSVQDAQIAATASVSGFAVATRNVKDFENCGIEVINPF